MNILFSLFPSPHTMMILSHLTSPLPPAVLALHIFLFLPTTKERQIPFLATVWQCWASLLECPLHILIILLVPIFALAWCLTENPPNYTCHSVQRRRALLTGWFNGLCVWWAGLVPCLWSRVTTTTQQWCLYVCWMVGWFLRRVGMWWGVGQHSATILREIDAS